MNHYVNIGIDENQEEVKQSEAHPNFKYLHHKFDETLH